MTAFCSYPFTHFEVNNPNGDVTFCCNHQLVLGNVNRQTMAEIWNGPAYQRVRRAFLDGRMGEYCRATCPVLQGWKDYEKLDWYGGLPADSPARVNAELNEREIAEGRTELRSRPRWLRFAASYQCNLRCYHCFQEEDRAQGEVLPDRFFVQVRELLPTAQVLFLYGGEPLLEPRNLALLDELAAGPKATRVFIATNGTILTSRIRETLGRVDIGLLAISLDTVDPARYAELRAPARWAETEENLRWFAVRLRGQPGRLHLTMTVNRQNMHELADFIRFARPHGAVPDFQLAGNAFQRAAFRERYELLAGDVPALLGAITAARAALDDSLPPAVGRNLDDLERRARALRPPGRLRRMARRLRAAWTQERDTMTRYQYFCRELYRHPRRRQRLLDAALAEQGMLPEISRLERIVPDISDQYNTPASRLRTPEMLPKVRAMHAFQIALVRETLATLGGQDDQLTVVDLGDSAGNHLRYLLAERPQLRTVSVNLDSAAVAKIAAKGLRAIRARAEDLAAYDIHPDLIMCFQMLEHVLDPIGFLKKLGDGPACRCLVLTVPLLAQSRVALNYTRRSALPPAALPAEDVHVYELSPDDWRALLSFAGWRVVREQRYYQYPRRTLLRRLWRDVLRAGDYEGFVGFVACPDGSYRDAYRHWA